MPGGFQASLLLTDLTGNQTLTKHPMRVRDQLGHVPPSILIKVEPGGDSSTFSFDYTLEPADAGASIFWDTGHQADTSTVLHHAYSPGESHIRVFAKDDQNLWATDLVTIDVPNGSLDASTPCQLVLEDFLTPVFTSVDHDVFPNQLATIGTDAIGGSPPLTVAYADAGLHFVSLTSRVPNKSCVDEAPVIVYTPPTIASHPPVLDCESSSFYTPTVAGDGPFTFSLTNNVPGVSFDAATGRITWAQPYVGASFTLTVKSWAGTASQTFTVTGACDAGTLNPVGDGGMSGTPPSLDFQTQPCGCSSFSGGGLLALACAAWLRRRRR